MFQRNKITRRHLLGLALASSVGLTMASTSAFSSDIDSIHFLIPGGAGGGWDGTARGTGEALSKSGIIKSASYENMSGGGGGKAIGYLIENAASNHGTLMVNSTPIVIRSLVGRFPHNFRDLTMIAGTIGDYGAIITGKDSPYKDFKDLVAAYKKNPRNVSIGGGSVPGGMDHLVAAMAFQGAGADPTKVKYIPFDAGGKLNASILSGEVAAGSTGFSEAIALAQSGEMRILAVTSDKRVPAFDKAPTLKEQGIDVTFVNWRGFFGAPGLPDSKAKAYRAAIAKMYDTPEWEAVRSRNGWVNIHNPGDKFIAFLEAQETIIKDLMTKLGFL
ncbi:MAG: tripartite tricarboxylate transporter substrate binding protein [Oceanicoccus sp.]|uniref:Bug family tripartite tricarboxylate transporter substrate binding protein n=1 Tax=Oceanicoccus sp. TaxID=2691044 RepID=UPI00260CFA46|nr:tripartite tricarboxylate transporter substrate-binding protein [Oceanicoccus sp.]MCP3908831.1 tripartite tricarboxylate transporter substrate binding protein [Oceanicoccus sp.]